MSLLMGAVPYLLYVFYVLNGAEKLVHGLLRLIALPLYLIVLSLHVYLARLQLLIKCNRLGLLKAVQIGTSINRFRVAHKH